MKYFTFIHINALIGWNDSWCFVFVYINTVNMHNIYMYHINWNWLNCKNNFFLRRTFCRSEGFDLKAIVCAILKIILFLHIFVYVLLLLLLSLICYLLHFLKHSEMKRKKIKSNFVFVVEIFFTLNTIYVMWMLNVNMTKW